ncbi:DUF4419 domain-containing protein [Pedobacter sp. UBA5917]|jgi:hypothetical protein|uniref:DUF4419 domain-containing protein n=1 Tax=Pedobacter sp. UBA5917 TaxID=1947061 RepID=UPI0025CC3315|nr:DUF4419 domain-containing protein [Pedobacter sp. UBA5917]
MKNILLFFLIFICAKAFCQNATVVEIETLSKPAKFIPVVPSSEILKVLKADIEKNVENLPDSLVYYGKHPFLTGILNSYIDHRPFVISPDIFWLLISQGFARHVTQNAEELRSKMVNFDGRKTLTVMSDKIQIGNPKSDWASIFPQFNEQVNDYTGKKLVGVLTSDFTTTTATSKIVNQVTIMETVKSYFEFKVIIMGCGIPKVTIEGTTQDWKKLLEKTKYLSQYKLDWWTNELVPIIEEIIAAKKGKVNKDFWMNMVKYHTEKKYGTVNTIDGWIVKFFPYTKEGNKTGLKPITSVNSLASEIVKVPFILLDDINHTSNNMEIWAGFIGLSQNNKDFTMKPEMSWAIINKNSAPLETSVFDNKTQANDLSMSNISEIPKALYNLKSIGTLRIKFTKNIIIPDELAKININRLELTGAITEAEKQRVIKLFPNCWLIINGEMIDR